MVVVGEVGRLHDEGRKNFKLNGFANKTIEKLTMGVVNCSPSFSGFRLKPQEGSMGI